MHPPPSPRQSLATGYEPRAANLGDLQRVFELIRDCQLADHDAAHIDVEDIESDWNRPGFDVARDGTFVIDERTGAIVAYAEVFASRAEAWVLPAARGHGIGTWLASFIECRARDQGATFVRQVVGAKNEASIELLVSVGYEHSDTGWILGASLGDVAPAPPPPDSVTVREFGPGVDDPEVWRLIEDAFAHWPNHVHAPLEAWRAVTVLRSGFEPWMLPLLEHGGEVVGAAYCIDNPDDGEVWIQQLAVRADLRGRGLGTMLLHEVFARAASRGRVKAGLSTDSRTGALGLYERVGMRVSDEYAAHALQLR